jgi:hypothetical protein
MTTKKDSDWNERVLDALIVLALRGDLNDADVPDLDGPEPLLSEEDLRALKALGPDLGRRIVREGGRYRGRRQPRPPSPTKDADLGRTGTLNRSKPGAELSDKAREEMERRIRELEAENDQEPQP